MNTPEFTKKLLSLLEAHFTREQVIKEWNVAKNSNDNFNAREYYAPRVDIAIGPFNIDGKIENNNALFTNYVNSNPPFLEWLYNNSHLGENEEYINFYDFKQVLNDNPRCLYAIEIENTGGSKHCLGDMLNASVMGKIGIVIPLSEDKYTQFIKLKKYLHYLERVGKLKGNLRNILIIKAEKFLHM